MSELPQLLARLAKKQLDQFCRDCANDPLHPRQVDYRIEGLLINLFEIHEQRQLSIAQIRFSQPLNQWTLHHQNGQHWQLYLNLTPSLEFGKLLCALRQDPFGHFWRQ